MEIFIDDIVEEGLEIEGNEADSWVQGIFKEALGDHYIKGDPAHVSATIVRFENNVTLDGRVEFLSHQTCDRCLKEFTERVEVPFHTVLIPMHERREAFREDEEEVELKADDLEFGYYEGDRIDLGGLIGEQVLLAESMKHLCSVDCKGLCQQCGKNLNEGPCDCMEDHTDPRWEALKGVKISHN